MKTLIERNKLLMKKFETMINTADEVLAEELVASDAPFYTPASPDFQYAYNIGAIHSWLMAQTK
mgnify:CR=1 FL=1